MSRIPSNFAWHSMHPRRKVTFARVYDARSFEDDLFWSGTSVCEVVAASPSDISFTPDGGLRILDIGGGQHYLPPEMVGETHIQTVPIGKALDLRCVVNPDQPLRDQVADLYRRMEGRTFICAACYERIPPEQWERANIEVELNDHRTYAQSIRAVHATPQCAGSFARHGNWYRFRIATVMPG